MSTTQTPGSTGTHGVSWRPLARHYVEMLVAMVAGMVLIGGLRALLGLDVPMDDRPGTAYTLMAIDMSAGMAAWMRYRGHGWPGTLEMCAAMFVPWVLLPLVWAGTMGPMAFMSLAHVIMPIAMLAVLLRRRDEFGHPLT